MSAAMRITGARGIASGALIAAVSVVIALSSAKPAEGGVFVGFGFGFPIGFPAYFYPPFPYLYAYPYYPPFAYYSAPGYYSPSEGYPLSTGYPPTGGNPPGTPSITYTPRLGWTNAQGQYCREYKATQGTGSRATERYGTACRDADGQWRVVN